MFTNYQQDITGTEPFTLQEVKDWVIQSESFDDNILTALITASREGAEKYTGRSYIEKTVTLSIANNTDQLSFPLLYSPIIDVTSVTDAEGNDITHTIYGKDEKEVCFTRVYPEIVIEYTVGGTFRNFELAKNAMKHYIMDAYENRGEEGTMFKWDDYLFMEKSYPL